MIGRLQYVGQYHTITALQTNLVRLKNSALCNVCVCMHVSVHMYCDQDRSSDPSGKKQLTTVSMETGERRWKSVSLCMHVICVHPKRKRE